MKKYPNKIVINRKSPKNEEENRRTYAKLNPGANKKDNLDIAAVKLKDGTLGYVLLDKSINRSKDRKPHVGKSFISQAEIKEKQRSKK